jgi:hypothetical protein
MITGLSELVCSPSARSTRNLSERHQPSPVALAEVLARDPSRVASSRVSRCGKPAAASGKAGSCSVTQRSFCDPARGRAGSQKCSTRLDRNTENLGDPITLGGQAHREVPCHVSGRVAGSSVAECFAGTNLSRYRRIDPEECLHWILTSARAHAVQQFCNGDTGKGRGQGLMGTGRACLDIAPVRDTHTCILAAAVVLTAGPHLLNTTGRPHR